MSGPLPRALLPLTIPASWLYRGAIAVRNRKFDQSIGVNTIDRSVISIGNITTGGTGKSPMVAWVADLLRLCGCSPLISMRGYGATKDQESDEEAEYSHRLPGVPVLAFPDRTAALRAFLPEHPEIDCVILDDGFQHRQLKRDLDIVLIDATSDTFNERLLPAGHLREPLNNLARAHAVIVTHAQHIDERVLQNITLHHGMAPIAWSRHIWSHLLVHDRSDQPLQGDLGYLAGKRVTTMLGVGKPNSILQQLESLGATIASNIPAKDHQRYDQAKLNVAKTASAGCEALVVTGKDWVKLRHLIDWTHWPLPIVVPQLAIEVFEGVAPLQELVISTVRDSTVAAR